MARRMRAERGVLRDDDDDYVVPQDGGGRSYYGTFPQRRARINAAATRAENAEQIAAFDLSEGIAALTPEEAAQLNEQIETGKAWIMSDDPVWQQAGREKLEAISQELRAGAANRAQGQRDLVLGALEDQRTRYTKASEAQAEIYAPFKEAADLLNTEGIDVNHELVRTRLMDTLKVGPRQFLDPEDMADALAAGGAGVPVIGALIEIFAGRMAAEDFEFTKEDWRGVLRGAYISKSMPYVDATRKIAESTQQLEAVAAMLKTFPTGYSPLAYVMEQDQDYTNPISDVPNSYPELEESAAGVDATAGGILGGIRDMANENAERVRDEREQREAALDVPAELGAGTGFLDFEGYYKPFRDDGAKILVDRRTGEAYAEYDDGRQVPIEQNALIKLRNKKRIWEQEHGSLK